MLIVYFLLSSFHLIFLATASTLIRTPQMVDCFCAVGLLVGKKGGPRHINCPDLSSGYKVGGLFLEMEYCPFSHCSKTFMDPESNISHQEEVHRSVKTWMCSICEINFVSEGCSTRHILSFHREPMGYAEDLSKIHEDSQPFSFST